MENTSCVESCGGVKMIYGADARCALGVYRALEAMPCQQAGGRPFRTSLGGRCSFRGVSASAEGARRSLAVRETQGQRSARTSASHWTIGSLLFPFSAREPGTDLLCLELWTLDSGGGSNTHTLPYTRAQVRCRGLDWNFKHLRARRSWIFTLELHF